MRIILEHSVAFLTISRHLFWQSQRSGVKNAKSKRMCLHESKMSEGGGRSPPTNNERLSKTIKHTSIKKDKLN